MKIPSKRIVNAQISEQRRVQIEEGVILAKKIDILRSSLLDLQKQREEYLRQQVIEVDKKADYLSIKLLGMMEAIDVARKEHELLKKENNKLKDGLSR